jgi:hypothetical protein
MNDAAGANRRSRKQQDSANKILDRLKGLSTKQAMLAEAYDPVAEAKAAEEYATRSTGKGFGMALDNWNAGNIRGGGSIGSDSLNLTYANNIASKYYDPVRASIYQTAANATNAKIATLGGAMASGQSLANAFTGSAQSNQIDPTGSMQLLSGAINTLGKAPPTPSTTGSSAAGTTKSTASSNNAQVGGTQTAVTPVNPAQISALNTPSAIPAQTGLGRLGGSYSNGQNKFATGEHDFMNSRMESGNRDTAEMIKRLRGIFG